MPCATCKYSFHPPGPLAVMTNNQVICKRYTPKPLVVPVPQLSRNQPPFQLQAVYPQMAKDDECGEYVTKLSLN